MKLAFMLFALLVCRTPAFAQGAIGTFAGIDHTFTDNGQPASSSQLAAPAAIAFDGQGNLYIADRDLNMVLEVGPDGVIHAVAGNGLQGFQGDYGPATSALLNGPTGLAFDSAGFLYVADKGNQLVRVITPDGTIFPVAGAGYQGFAGDGDYANVSILNNPSSVAVDANDNLYILDSGNQRVRFVDFTTGLISTIAGNGTAGAPKEGVPATQTPMSGPAAICLDAQGNLYIVDQGNSVVRRMTTDGIINTVAGTAGQFGFRGDGGPATAAVLFTPGGVGVDAAGNIYISDYWNHRVRRVDPSGVITTVAGTGAAAFSGDGSSATSAAVSGTLGIAANPNGKVYIADSENNRVRAFTPGGSIATVAGRGLSLGDSGPAISGWLHAPSALAIDSAGDLFIADTGQNRIRKVAPNGVITTVAGSGRLGNGGDGNQATSANLQGPQAVAVGKSGTVYIADTYNGVIRQVNPAGVISILAGGYGRCCYAGDGGPAAQAALQLPTSMVVDAAGNVFSTNSSPTGVRVRRVAPDGTISTVAGAAAGGSSANGVPALQAAFGFTVSLGLDASGNLLIADYFNHLVRRVGADGTIATIAGNGDELASGDGGPATAAGVPYPTSVTADAAGNLYISSASDLATYAVFNDVRATATVRRVAPDGTITTYTGSQPGFGGDGGRAAGALLSGPTGLVVDAAGNLYIADQNNDRVRVVSPR